MHISDSEISLWLDEAVNKKVVGEKGLVHDIENIPGAETLLYLSSIQRKESKTFVLLKLNNKKALGIFGPYDSIEGFEGVKKKINKDFSIFSGPLNHKNAEKLRLVLPFTAPSKVLNNEITFMVGDRLCIAGPGHIRAFRGKKAIPVLAAGSVRENIQLNRTFEDILDSSTWAVFQEGYTDPWGADGDHLKTEDWVKKVLETGFTMITADVSDYIKTEFEDKATAEMITAYKMLDEDYRDRIEKKYLLYKVELDSGTMVEFSKEKLMRTALIYKEAIEHAARLYQTGVDVKGKGGFEFELSIDESSVPTNPQVHVFVALEAKEAGIKISSLAPRFIGEFQKGIDYIGNMKEFEKSFETHAAICRKFGYKISIHSGSDKFKVYPIIARLSKRKYHLKTAGTYWLEAMKLTAQKDPILYRTMHEQVLMSFNKAREYYHITINMDNLPLIESLADEDLPATYNNPDVRQLIHISYGILGDLSIKKLFDNFLKENSGDYLSAVERHVDNHFIALGI